MKLRGSYVYFTGTGKTVQLMEAEDELRVKVHRVIRELIIRKLSKMNTKGCL